MSSTAPVTLPYAPAGADNTQSARWLVVLLGSMLVLAVYVAGAPGLDAPWVIGDEFIFIVGNPDVNPPATPLGRAPPLSNRLVTILTKVHDDLYQPIPILSYALEWTLSGGEPASFRRTDLLIHALNALLLWGVLAGFLARCPWGRSGRTSVLAWAVALLWALHPILVSTYAADMGRTHLLSATFALLALGWYGRSVATGRIAHFLLALAALLLAMLCKPIPGWVLVALILEAAALGWRRTLQSPRVYIVGVICVVFAVLTAWTTRQSGMTEDIAKALFGDPVARSMLAVWLYFRDLITPIWLAFWHLPDPRTGWKYWAVWVGLLLTLASLAHAGWSWRSGARVAAVGWAWSWGLLLPVIGLVGAREVAAADRYMYQPLMGIALVVAVVLSRWLAGLSAPASGRTGRALLAGTGILALAMLVWDWPQALIARSTIRRATRVVDLNPGDPRALQALAAAYDFAQNHPLPPADLERIPPGQGQFAHFHRLWVETLRRMATAASQTYYFGGRDDQSSFHRWLSFRLLLAGEAEESLAQAEQSVTLSPDTYMSWVRMAQAYRVLGRFPDAARAFDRCELLLPTDRETRAAHYTDYGTLLMDLDRDSDACPKFQAAMATGCPPPQAAIGWAQCLIRYGTGEDGYKLISQVLNADPGNVRAGLVLAEYHLLSHHFEQALAVYGAILGDQPTNYRALRGFHEACLQLGRYRDAAVAWHDALQKAMGRREFESYLVWALALAADEGAGRAADDLLSRDSDNPLACFAQMLISVRASDLEGALRWINRARKGTPIPQAQEFRRAAAALHLLAEPDRHELPPEATIAEAAIYLRGPGLDAIRSEAQPLLDGYLSNHPDSRWAELVRRLQRELSDPPDAR